MQENARAGGPPSPPDLLDCRGVCRLLGGINPATLYRGIRQGRYPKPLKIGPGTSRWLRSECENVLRTLEAAR